MQGTNTNDLRNIISTISTKLHKNDIASEIHYRLKDPCSALKKVLRKIIALKELTDLIAFRIIVDKKEDCYKVLDIIYNIYSVNVEKSKNYIANPKDNGYRSLHVIVVVGIYERNVEIQIRSRKMHNTAESGTASHDEYKKMQEAKLRSYSLMGGLIQLTLILRSIMPIIFLAGLIGLYQNSLLMNRQLRVFVITCIMYNLVKL